MLLPTVFLGLEVLVAAVLEPGVLGASLDACVLGRVGVFVSATLGGAGFLAVDSDLEADLGVSGFADLFTGRERGESTAFLAAGVDGLVTSTEGKHRIEMELNYFVL